MKNLEQILRSKGYSTSSDKEQEVIYDCELILTGKHKNKKQAAEFNLSLLYYNDGKLKPKVIKDVVYEFLEGLA